jgi:membrane associated rhomboid family serine protease
MFSDRNYNNRRSFGGAGNTAVPSLILLCIIVYILQEATAVRIGTNFSYSPVTYYLELNPQAILKFQIWRFITYMFAHGGFWHIAINMWGLYLFGSLLEKRMGTLKFLLLYFVSGIAGGLLWFAFNWNSYIPCVGASAALFGVMTGAAMLYPDMMIMLLIPPIPLKLKTFVLLYAAIESFSSILGVDTYVAHLAHLGGLAGGYLLMRIFFPRDTYNIFQFFKNKLKKRGAKKKGFTVYTAPQQKPATSTNTTLDSVDEILDKISHSGINSLTQEELDSLKKAREQMMKKK